MNEYAFISRTRCASSYRFHKPTQPSQEHVGGVIRETEHTRPTRSPAANACRWFQASKVERGSEFTLSCALSLSNNKNMDLFMKTLLFLLLGLSFASQVGAQPVTAPSDQRANPAVLAHQQTPIPGLKKLGTRVHAVLEFWFYRGRYRYHCGGCRLVPHPNSKRNEAAT